MRSFLVLSMLTTALVACGATAASDPTPSDSPPPTATATCESQAATICDAAESRSVGGPTHEGAVLWAQPYPTTIYTNYPDGTTTLPQLAVYADGTVRRTPVARNLDIAFTPIHGQIVGALSPAALERVKQASSAIRPDVALAWGRIADTDAPPPKPGSLTLLDVEGGLRSCFAFAPKCTPAEVKTLSATVDALFAATEAKWRDARAGTVSLGREMTILGPWPLDESLAHDGELSLSNADYAKLKDGAAYRLSSGDFVSVEVSYASTSGGTNVYLSRRSAYRLDDEALRADLFANQNRYDTTQGEWLGIELGDDRFPAAKNRELAIDPSTTKVYWFRAIEHLDLRGDGAIDL